jgi:uncharacterized protein YdhG (YjbR/CyaY superfamily)
MSVESEILETGSAISSRQPVPLFIGDPMESKASEITTIDEYIAGFPAEVQAILQQVRAAVKAAAPQASEKISYAMPTFFLEGNLVYFAAFKNHIGFYPAPQGIEAFAEELARYKGAKGSVQFPIDQPMPLELIGRIVKFRMEGNLAKAQAKRRKK